MVFGPGSNPRGKCCVKGRGKGSLLSHLGASSFEATAMHAPLIPVAAVVASFGGGGMRGEGKGMK